MFFIWGREEGVFCDQPGQEWRYQTQKSRNLMPVHIIRNGAVKSDRTLQIMLYR
jgi:hypothetical protein